MPFRQRKIKVTQKTIGGGGVKHSFLKNTPVSHPYSSVNTAVPGTSTEPVPHEEASSNEETAYSIAKAKELSVWTSLRPELLRVSLESAAPSSNLCFICKDLAEYRCRECSHSIVFCETCVKATHRNSLHLPEKWNVSTYSQCKRKQVMK